MYIMKILLVLLIIVCITGCSNIKTSLKNPEGTKDSVKNYLMIADFNLGNKPNNLKKDFGAWNKDDTDTSQGCVMEFSKDEKIGKKGYSLKLIYDVLSENVAYNGFWMKLGELDARDYKSLVFSVKGDKREKFTSIVKVELKNSLGEVGKKYIDSISENWQDIIIPLDSLKGLRDYSSLTEFVIVFEDSKVTEKTGTIYIDNIKLVK